MTRLTQGGAERPGEKGAAELLARLPEPEADELAQERVWRALSPAFPRTRGTLWFSPPAAAWSSGSVPAPGRPRRWALALIPAAAATAAVLAFALRGAFAGPASARLAMTAGAVLAAAPEHGWSAAEAGARLPAASRLRTGGQARAVVALSRAALLVDPGSDLGLESLDRHVFLRLSGGRLVAEVERRRAGESFEVQTTRFRVTVKGTIFSVTERSADDVEVSVSRGLVEVSGAGSVWQVAAGQSWRSRTASERGADDIPAHDRQLLEETSNAGPLAPIRVTGPAGPEVSEEGVELGPTPLTWDAPVGRYHFVGSTGGEAEGDAATSVGVGTTVALTVARHATAIPTPTPTPTSTSTSTPTPASTPTPTAIHRPIVLNRHAPSIVPAISKSEPAPAPAPKPELLARLDRPAAPPSAADFTTPPQPAPVPFPAPPPPPPIVVAPDRYAEAVSLSRSGRYHEAEQALEAIAGSRGPHADLALYDLGRLRQTRLGDAAGALRAFVRYEAEYPKGSLAQEVELSAIEIELGRDDLPGALSQMQRFLAEHPDSERAPEVHVLRGDALRQRGDCRGALREYARGGGSGREDDALYFTAFCQQRLGEAEDAADSLRNYLKTFPNGHHLREVRAALGGR
ncbi:MAG: outer membrane protein assembly factor BamD [Myxococcales bacterium]